MTELDKLLAGEPFDFFAPEMVAMRKNAERLLRQIAQTESELQAPLWRELFGALGEDSWVRAPLFCEYGKSIRIGSHTFLNAGATFLDGTAITIGNNVLVGPNVQFYGASHPIDHIERRDWTARWKPIFIEDDVWIGGNAVICQGVTIGARSIVGAGAVVLKDVPADTIVGGNPARIIRKIDANDR
ncbi:sugar O-acetyltransferase [Jeongeupia sp. USM3]|uniref:sugar O-acetyltransferase n=1 Tax=Jeongeupia sp. USM3 TaxID=1906741 RepID=UPI00089DDD07|nr:sugar O-acetyltransferase [Jeongeupia sp. USM3]AOY02261.1 acetyltransferase [Jeongeupia sp. USM3]